MAELNRRQLNRQQIEACLKSAASDLTPNVLERIDLSTPQIKAEKEKRSVFFLRQRVIATLVAACFCMIALAGGTYTYQNGKVDSVIGIDVNPSVELSVNKRNKVLAAKALNEDGESIMQDMDLKGVDLNTAVNAVIGSMVTHGYLSELDNAILVTVSNDSISKAQGLRHAVVNDIRNTLEEKQLKAVVYDQQVMEEDEVKQLAEEYKISYGKAYFLRELILQNPSLSMDDMKALAPLTMEEIAKVITERSYAVEGKTAAGEETTTANTTQAATEPETIAESSGLEESKTAASASETESQSPAQVSQTQPTAPTAATTAEETTSEEEVVSTEKIKVDYVDYDNGVVMVYFKTKVKWKNPTVSINDGDKNSYSAKVGDTDSYSCEIHVTGLQGGMEYTFTLGGISPKIGKQTTVKGIFETPVIGDGNADPEETEEESENTSQPDQTAPATPSEETSETVKNIPETGKNVSPEETRTTKSQEESSKTGSSS
uniref:anti-sigma-I factor RsgI family protein n=1 Tax=Clostridium sp. NkU-1 TaxID=1095009 RepID=UPI0006D2B02A